MILQEITGKRHKGLEHKRTSR